MTQIKPSSFFSETPPERIIGVECEYNLQHYGGGNDYDALWAYIDDDAVKAAGFNRQGKFLGNGGGLYRDVGHLEYDTQECLGPRQAAAADKAGTLVLSRILLASEVPHNGLYRMTGSYKSRGADPKAPVGRTSGYHVNLLLPRAASNSKVLDMIIPSHLATQIYAMSGTLRDRFVFSQKVGGVGGEPIARTITRRTDHGNKPMCIIPPPSSDADVLGNEDWARVEVRFADACHSPSMLYLSFAATSLVLRIVEHQKMVGRKKIEGLTFNDPVTAAKIFARDLTLKKTATTRNNRHLTAIDMQEAFAETAAILGESVDLPEDEKQAINLWFYICARLRESNPSKGEYNVLARLMDVAAKHVYLLHKNNPKDLNNRNDDAMQQSMIWDRILPEGGNHYWLQTYPSAFVSTEEVESLINTAPHTRAEIRAYCINDPEFLIDSLTWASVIRDGKVIGRLPDPYDNIAAMQERVRSRR